MTLAALVGAGLGLVMGAIQYGIATAVIGRLIEAERVAAEEDGERLLPQQQEEFERKVASSRRRLFWVSMVALPVAGFVIGQVIGAR